MPHDFQNDPTTHTFPMHINCVPDSEDEISIFEIWDGEVNATVFQHIGAHGFPSAAIVVRCCDDPIKVFSWSGYGRVAPGQPKKTELHMRMWIVEQLNLLATGTQNATGSFSEIKRIK